MRQGKAHAEVRLALGSDYEQHYTLWDPRLGPQGSLVPVAPDTYKV
jgi:hypothetical protein